MSAVSLLDVIHLMDNERCIVKVLRELVFFSYTLSCCDWAIVYARTILCCSYPRDRKKKETQFFYFWGSLFFVFFYVFLPISLGRRRRPDLKTVTLDLSQRTTVA
jgi:hypothetical protein